MTPIGPQGGGFRSADAVLSLILPPGAVASPVVVTIGLVTDRQGARNTAAYHVDITSAADGAPVELAKPATLIMDLSGPSVSIDTGVASNLRLGNAINTDRTTALQAIHVHGRASTDPTLASSLQFIGVSFNVTGDVGLIETPPQGRAGGPLPACIEKCFTNTDIAAVEGGACGVDGLGGQAQLCLSSCDAASLEALCKPAPSINCGGTSCASCCFQHGKLSCDAACATGALEGKVTVDCLVDSDCGSGGACCVPEATRGGGTLTVKGDRVTCRTSCDAERVHLCDVTDPNRCATCSAARINCDRGFCDTADATASALVCPL